MKFNLFQKVAVSFGLMAIVVLLAGCPYSSSVPIDDGTVKVPVSLAGKWISTADTATENPPYYVISKDDEFHAIAKKMEFSSSDSTYNETEYYLTFSDVDGEIFMNAMEKEGISYSLYKFNFNEKAGEIYTSEVSDYIKETFSTSKELKDFVAKNKSNSYFFTNTSDTYIRN
jgi:hypothetical protein